jgi:acyl carrier protein
MNPEQGWEAFARALALDAPQLCVLPVNWNAYAQQFGEKPPAFLGALITKPHVTQTETGRAQTEPGFEQRLQSTPKEKRASLILAHVREQTVKILGLPPSRRVEIHQPLREMGLDSLMTVELRNALSTTLGRALPGSLVFDYPTIAAISSFLAEKVFSVESSAASSLSTKQKGDEHEQQTLAHVQQLDEAEAEALLLEKLATLDGRL